MSVPHGTPLLWSREGMKKLTLTFVLVAAAGTGLSLVPATSGAPSQTTSNKFWDPVLDVYSTVQRHYFKSPEYEKMQEGVIKGMLEALEDPYTEFIPNKDVAKFDKEVRGEFVGIGAEVRGTDDGFLLIVSPLDDSPAYKAGVEADDVVVAVDGVSVYNLDVDEIISKLTGEPNTPVRVTFEREGTDADIPQGAQPASIPDVEGEARGPKPGWVRFDLEIVRQRIQSATLKGLHRDGEKWDFMVDPNRKIAYVRLQQFTTTTGVELEKVCRELLEQGMRGMILDLRFNGGGALSAAIQTSDLFLSDESNLIVKTKGRTTSEERVYARADGTLPDFPLIVMVNDASASASEIVAGSLSDNGRAIVLGTRSFGKGLVQSIYRLPSGAGQLKITEAYYYLPSGRCIQREDESTEWGVDPSPGFYVPMTDAEIVQMWRVRRAEEVIRNAQASEETQKNWADPEWILSHLKDTQLSAAVKAIGTKLDTGEWVGPGENAPAGTLEMAALKKEERRYDLLAREMARSAKRMDTLRKGEPEEKPLDLIPSTEKLANGTIEVRDSEGKVISVLRITGDDLEAWLNGAPLEPEAVPVHEESSAGTTEPTPPTQEK